MLYQFSSVAQSCLTLCNPMNRSMPGLPVHHQHLEFTQSHAHSVSHAQLCPILCHPMDLSILGFPVHRQHPEPAQTHGHWVSDTIQPSHLLSSPSPPPLVPPSIRVFSSESTLHMRWPKYWSSASASFLPKKSQGWSPSEWTVWISLQSKGL